ncbi:MAG: hypothetical protein B1H03_03275 [Planctomycetales bacterium 4484_113]|nr:MAG: hypothetical protein B1H03_03275 [Planctomycetales bacterium 4484_113]
MLKVEAITASYNDVPVLDRVSMTAHERRITAVIGSSGSGKSTLLRVIMGFIKPSSGRVLIEGEDICSASEAEVARIRAKMGLVFQESALFDSLTVEENVAFFPIYHQKRRWRQVRPEVNALLAELGLGDIGGKYPGELSGGMRRRVALARTLIYHPRVLLYDEPTTGLDPTNIATVDDIIKEMNERFEVTSVVVTHDLESVLHVADWVYLLDEGHSVEVGPPKHLLTSDHPRVVRFTASWRKHIDAFRKLPHTPISGVAGSKDDK